MGKSPDRLRCTQPASPLNTHHNSSEQAHAATSSDLRIRSEASELPTLPTPPSTFVTGMVALGPASASIGTDVTIHDPDWTTLLGRGAVDECGKFSINIGNFTGPLIACVEVRDEVSGVDAMTGTTLKQRLPLLMAVEVARPGQPLALSINPISTMATHLAGVWPGSTPQVERRLEPAVSFVGANAAVANALGLDNDGSADAVTMIVDAMYGIARAGESIGDTITDLVARLVSSLLDGTGRLNERSAAALINGARVAGICGCKVAAIIAPGAATSAATLGPQLAPSVLDSLTPAVAANLSPAQFTSITAFGAIPPYALTAIPPNYFSGLKPAQIATLEHAQLRALTADHFSALAGSIVSPMRCAENQVSVRAY